jgi:hypothetical protein
MSETTREQHKRRRRKKNPASTTTAHSADQNSNENVSGHHRVTEYDMEPESVTASRAAWGEQEGQELADDIDETEEEADDLEGVSDAANVFELSSAVIGELAGAGGFFGAATGMALVGAVASMTNLYLTLSDARQKQEVKGEQLGIRLGIAAANQLCLNSRVPRLSEKRLVETILAGSIMSYSWNQQIRYAGASGPEVVEQAMRTGIKQVVNQGRMAVLKAAAAYVKKKQQVYPGAKTGLTAQEWSEIRRVVYQNMSNKLTEASQGE